uniref:Uncharacterized protein n=1 Tax=Caenorhabditis tropicalis TaxID=1561998 RepID=A0A1I7UHB9_9PELO
MLKNFLSLVKPNNKEKKKKKSVSGPSASTPVATDTSFFSEADASILSNSPPKALANIRIFLFFRCRCPSQEFTTNSDAESFRRGALFH